MRRKLANIIIGLIFLAGLGILLYPSISDYVNERNSSRAIAAYNQLAAELPPEDYTQELEDAAAYNAYLTQFNSLSAAATAETEREDSPYESLLNVGGDGIMAVIRIPSIDVNLPIYHGTSESVLQVGVGHLEGSSLPVGGESTHCVVSGHRGLPSARLFTDLDRMEEGDIFSLYVLNEKLSYEVDQILVVEPAEVDALAIEEGEDYCTLVTCTPYGINTHRLLVRGHRVENVEEPVEVQVEAETMEECERYVDAVIDVIREKGHCVED